MTHLLGRQDCIDSLRRDLIDLQGSVLDVFSRTGPVKCPSWKFPDKLSCNLDLVLLLEKYDFAEGEDEFNQHTHIVLLELVIDRLMLLLQSFSAHIDIILGGKGKCSGTSQTALSVSIGPVVANFWNNLVQLGKEYPRKNVLKPMPASKSAQSQLPTSRDSHPPTTSTSSFQDGSRGKHNPSPARRSLSSIPHHNTPRPTAPSASSSTTTASSLTHLQLNQSHPHLPSPSSSSSPSLSATSTPSCLSPSSHIALHTSTPNISADCHSVGCQTVESSLVPCDACAGVQTSLRESGVALVGLCEALGMPCSLRPLLAVAEGSALAGRLSACDVAQWASEQRKDLGRLATHHNEVRGMLDGLKERAKKAEQEKGMLQVQMEGETKRRTRAEDERKREGEEWERRMREERRRADEERERLQEEVEELKKGAAAMEGNITELSAQLNMQSDVLHTVEAEKDALQEEVMSYQAQEVTWAEGEERRLALEAELSSTRLLLDKECAKYQSATRQHESLQVKQRALLERVDSLVSECEELQTRLEETEELTHTSEERDALQQQLTQQQAVYVELEEERRHLAAQVAELESTVLGLRGELREADHRERMLVAFPELNPLPQGAPQSTGDVLGDMEQQLQVNCLRIRVLEKENSTLQTSLDKLRERGIARHLDPHQPSQVRGHQLGDTNQGPHLLF
ncbi:coiled-coil domain-containing protein 157 [Engraulis encrasicolus]|uniref:coiled-coil domain-containing protein 157 n=1 Tax=Engraulis encrasicolus TaxID=184585 RepID=UPI002FD5FDB2